jgi:hypothetical protein
VVRTYGYHGFSLGVGLVRRTPWSGVLLGPAYSLVRRTPWSGVFLGPAYSLLAEYPANSSSRSKMVVTPIVIEFLRRLY